MKLRSCLYLFCTLIFLFFTSGCKKSPTGPSTGSIQISSTPSGASIYLDGQAIGQVTPYTIAGVATGSHTIRLTLTNYKDWSQAVTINKNQTTTVYANLALLTGSLFITSSPAGAQIYLDGTFSGKITPDTLKDLTVGQHIIALRLAGHYTWRDTLQVQADTVIAIAASLEKGSAIYVVGQAYYPAKRAYLSEDGGMTWEPLNDQAMGLNAYLTCVSFSVDGSLMLLGAQFGSGQAAFKSTDGGSTWIEISSGFGAARGQVSAIVCDPIDYDILYASLEAVALTGDGIYYSDGGYVVKSTNQGASWYRISSGLPLYGGGEPVNTAIYDLSVHPENSNILFAGIKAFNTSPVYRSTDGGASWQPLTSGLPTGGNGNKIVFDTVGPVNICLAYRKYSYPDSGGTFISNGDGATWDQAYVGYGCTSAAFDVFIGATVYAGAAGRVLKSEDGGWSWTEYPIGSAGAPTEVLVDPLASGKMFACLPDPYPGALYKSTDAGLTWQAVQLPANFYIKDAALR